MIFKSLKNFSILISCISRFLRVLILLCLVIISANYIRFHIQSSYIFSQPRQLPNLTSINIQPQEQINQLKESEKSMVVSFLEGEKEKNRKANASFIQKLKQIEQEIMQENYKLDEWGKLFKAEKETLLANATLYREAFDYMAVALRNMPYHGVQNYIRYARARLGMLPLKNAKQIKPEFGPEVNDFLSFRYRLSPPPCQDVAANRSVFIAVISAPYNFDKRNIIRQTWRNHLKVVETEGLMGLAGFAFILGLTENNLTQSKIDEESKKYGDIIQIKMSDFYRNLSLKVAGLLNWLYRNCTNADFILKADDDVYVNVRNLAHFVQSYHPSNQSIFGTSAGPFTPHRSTTKWTITFEEWPWNQYPPYFIGSAIIMPQSTIDPLFAASQTIPLMPFEDVYLTGICAEKTGVKLQFSTNSFSVFQKGWPVGCNIRRVIAWMTENMNGSHVLVENFYNNFTHKCTVTDSTGINREVSHNEPVLFSFN